MPNNLSRHYQKLLQKYGDPVKYWPQWCAESKSTKEREKIVIGMILVQRTSWHNANIALKNLKREGLLSVQRISRLKKLDRLTKFIRPAGFFQSKPKRLFDVCSFIVKHGGIKKLMREETKTVREKLLGINGVGQETADTILLYVLNKPVFIIDEYTRRWTERNALAKEKEYNKLQQFFHERLRPELTLYQNFHALIIISQRGREKSMMEIV